MVWFFGQCYWGVGTGEPSPKLSKDLRYVRWRRYFLHLKLSGITMTAPDSEQIKLGPPHLRNCDKQRMELINCFALSVDTGQFASNSRGCHTASNPASPFPQFPNVNDDSIIPYQYKSIWTLDINDYKLGTSASQCINDRTYNNDHLLWGRTNFVSSLFANRRAEWGSKSCVVTTAENETKDEASDWFTSDVYHEFYVDNGNDDWKNDRPAKQQKLDKDEM